MEEDIHNYSPTAMFPGTPPVLSIVDSGREYEWEMAEVDPNQIR